MRTGVGFLALAALLTAFSIPVRAAEVYRFLDTTTEPVASVGIEGVLKTVLTPLRWQQVFELPPQQGTPTLSFSIGLQPTPLEGTVRFAIDLERNGAWQPLYSKDLSKPGWVDERVVLPADLGKVSLRFQRRLVAGTRDLVLYSAFGDPVLLPAAPAKRPSVILISLDTLRGDRLGLAGYPKARTPVLDAFGRSGIWYTDAYSPSAWTLPSHAALLYGRSVPQVPERPSGIPTKPESLAEVLRAAGYLTAAFTGGGYLAPPWRFHLGFDTYFAFLPGNADGSCEPQRFDGPEVFRRATAWLRDRGQTPFFLFLHTYDVHDRCPFRRETKGNPAVPWDNLDEEGNVRLLSYYDDLIADTDTRVGAFLDEIDQLGLRDNTLIVVTSDHGEFFNEHGKRGHGCMPLYEPLIRVPLLVRYPARLAPRGPDRHPVSLVDVAPTILKLLEVPQPDRMKGVPLPGLGTPEGDTRPVVVACDDYVAVRQSALKLMASSTAPDQPLLFDLERDPGEKENLFAARSGDAQSLLGLAQQHWREASAVAQQSPARTLDAETKERLRALGYDP